MTGTIGGVAVAPPDALVAESSADSIVSPSQEPTMIALEELQADPARLLVALGVE